MRHDLAPFVPADPPLDGMPASRRAIAEVLGRLAEDGVADLPPIQGLSGLTVARWLYREWLSRRSSWQPLVHIDPQFAVHDQAAMLEAPILASGGWIFLDRGWESLDHAGLAEACRARGVWLLRHDPVRDPLVLRPEAVARLTELDRFHLVAVDPSLDELRRGLLSHCRSCSTIHLSGPPGTGKRTLARWAHATLDDRPMMEVRRGGAERAGAGRWMLFEEVGELEPDQRHVLREHLLSLQPRGASAATRYVERVPRPRHPAFDRILGTSPALCSVLARAARYAPRAISVLILGESGSGKELVARAVHEASGRRGPYKVVDLSTLNEQLIESELFGHKRGAYTGAESDRLGAFRKADGGTLFLDEIGNLTPRIQAKLLRVLQEKTVQPVGDDRVVPVDVRVVAATNANLEGMVSRGEFRADLLQRINAATLHLPPLRERPDDLLLLAAYFVSEARGVTPDALGERWMSAEAEAVMRAHPWPGNVRELENVARQATAESEDGVIEVHHLGPLAPENRRPVPLITTSSEPVGSREWELERHLVQRMTAVTFTLPPLRDREPESVRAAVLGLLGGRPIRIDALDAMERRAWWGNHPEVELELAAIRTNVDGAVDLAALDRTLPYLLDVGRQPIRVMLNPVLQPSGSVTGLQESFYEGALLIGRVARMVDLERLAGSADAEASAVERWRFVHDALGPAVAECLRLDHLSRLSRAHLLVTRDEDGLMVHTIPGARLPVHLTRLDTGESPEVLKPGASRSVGPAAEVRIDTTRSARVYLRLFLFAGAVAFEEYAPLAARRLERESVADKTAVDGGGASKNAAVWTSGMWTLERFERKALNDIVLLYPGGDFKAHLEAQLSPHSGEPDYARLSGYILRNRPTLYCTRLYTHPSNSELRQELWRAIQATPDPERRLSRLPTAIRRVLDESGH